LIFRLTALLFFSACLSFSQTPTPAGGRWVRIEKTDPKTGAQFVTFTLEANADLYNRHPTISITCSDRLKVPQVVYFADTILDTQIHDPMNYYANALFATVKIDKQKLYRAVWDIRYGENWRKINSMDIDRKTTKQLLQGTIMKVRYEGHLGQEFIDTFTIGGIDQELVHDACGAKFGKR
jgi:hypothetical protein